LLLAIVTIIEPTFKAMVVGAAQIKYDHGSLNPSTLL
jgi:hypothetical protein